MTNLFRASNWVSESQDSTTCALAGLGVVLGVGFGRAGRAGCAGCAALGWAWGWASAVTVFSSSNAINKQTTAREICQVWFRAGIKFVLLQIQTQQGDRYCNCCT